jgi:Family of unknown function (DUF6308)
MRELRIGGVVVDRDAALDHARHYLTDGSGWAYPSYDGYEADHAAGRLSDAGLLAPVLLNVSHMSIRTYEGLQAVHATLDGHLASVPVDLDLAQACHDDLQLLGPLFAVLDGDGVWGARGTVLAKVLHRKRPRFIPLYDEQVRRVYQDGADAPVPWVEGRSWQDFIILYAAAVGEDLRREATLWNEIAALAPGPPITPLRALDIVAWWAATHSSQTRHSGFTLGK